MARRNTKTAAQIGAEDEEKKREQDEAAAERAEDERLREKAGRKLFTAYRLWKVCSDKRCKRAQACGGDVDVCLRERWQPLVSPREKARLQKAIEFHAQGLSPREAATAAAADIAPYDASLARAEQMSRRAPEPSPAPVTLAPRPPQPERGPRIRTLW
jgi:hypothetical protein